MRKILVLGTAAAALALGVAAASAAPANSPYAVLSPEGNTYNQGPVYSGDPGYVDPGYVYDRPMIEGRSAYVYGDRGYADGYRPVPYGWEYSTEDNTYYSRGR